MHGTTTNQQLNFTGQHRCFIHDVPHSQANVLEGLIVSANRNQYIKMFHAIEKGSNAVTINESLPVVSVSSKPKDKACFGVVSCSEDPETREDAFGSFVTVSEKEEGDTRVYINSVGEGAIWVVNTNGPLESGDYITTSNVAGYGMRQDDDILHNYTVAKITMDCDFNPPDIPVQRIVKEKANVSYWYCPKYRNTKLSVLLDKTKEIMKPKMHLRVTLDIDISYEEASFIKETFMKDYDCREITLIPSKKDEEINSDLDLTTFESVDEIVAKELDSIESENYDKKTLMEIYGDLG